jgi:hypothetical protein
MSHPTLTQDSPAFAGAMQRPFKQARLNRQPAFCEQASPSFGAVPHTAPTHIKVPAHSPRAPVHGPPAATVGMQVPQSEPKATVQNCDWHCDDVAQFAPFGSEPR